MEGLVTLQGLLGFPHAERKSSKSPLSPLGPGYRTWARAMPTMKFLTLAPHSCCLLPTRQQRISWQNPCHEVLAQAYYVSIGSQPGAKNRPQGIRMNCRIWSPKPQLGIHETQSRPPKTKPQSARVRSPHSAPCEVVLSCTWQGACQQGGDYSAQLNPFFCSGEKMNHLACLAPEGGGHPRSTGPQVPGIPVGCHLSGQGVDLGGHVDP